MQQILQGHINIKENKTNVNIQIYIVITCFTQLAHNQTYHRRLPLEKSKHCRWRRAFWNSHCHIINGWYKWTHMTYSWNKTLKQQKWCWYFRHNFFIFELKLARPRRWVAMNKIKNYSITKKKSKTTSNMIKSQLSFLQI